MALKPISLLPLLALAPLLLLLAACSGDDDEPAERSEPEWAPERPHIGMFVDSEEHDGQLLTYIETDREGPAAEAGLRSGDRLVRFAGQPVAGAEEMMALVEARQIGDVIEVEVERYELRTPFSREADLVARSFEVTLVPEPRHWQFGHYIQLPHGGLRWDDQLRLGLPLADISPSLAEVHYLDSPAGVLVLAWPQPSGFVQPIVAAPVQAGFVLVSIQGQPVDYLHEVQAVIDRTRADRSIELVVRRFGVDFEVTLPPLGPDLPGANHVPAHARVRLQAALERGDLHPERLLSMASFYGSAYPSPGSGGIHFGAIKAVSRSQITIELFNSGLEWTAEISDRTQLEPSDGESGSFRVGEFVGIWRGPTGDIRHVISQAGPYPSR